MRGAAGATRPATDAAGDAAGRRRRRRPTVCDHGAVAPRGDGLLTHDLLPGEKGPQDACGVFGVWAPGEEVAKLAYFGLYALQHRGQESAGIATVQRRAAPRLQGHGPRLAGLRRDRAQRADRAHRARAHAGTRPPAAAPGRTPSRRSAPTAGGTVALGHNGNLTNTAELVDLVAERYGAPAPRRARPRQHDRHRARHRAARGRPGPHARGDGARGAAAAARRVLPRLHGREHALRRPRPAGRPPARARPPRARLGRRERDRRRWTSSARRSCARSSRASSSPSTPTACAPRGSRRSTAPAASSSTSTSPAPTPRSPAGPCTRRASRWAASSRASTPSTPTSSSRCRSPARPAAVGYAAESGIPFAQGLTKNAYVGRTFIQPSQTLRQLGIRLKLNPLREVIRGKRLVVVDDSIVRGNTQRALVRMLREAGAAEVHVRISLAAGEVAVLLRHRLRVAARSSSRTASASRRSARRSAPTRSATSRSRA